MKDRATLLNPWIIVLSCCLINFILDGMGRMSGIFFVAVQSAYGLSRQTASWPFTLCIALRNLSGPLVGVLAQKYGPGSVTLIGGVISSVGIGICYLANDITWIAISWGVIFGIGYGMGNILLPLIITTNFTKDISLATGLAFSGQCFGSLAWPAVLQFFFDSWGLHGTFLILGGVILNCIPMSMILIFHSSSNQQEYISFVKRKRSRSLITIAPVSEQQKPHVSTSSENTDINLYEENIYFSSVTMEKTKEDREKYSDNWFSLSERKSQGKHVSSKQMTPPSDIMSGKVNGCICNEARTVNEMSDFTASNDMPGEFELKKNGEQTLNEAARCLNLPMPSLRFLDNKDQNAVDETKAFMYVRHNSVPSNASNKDKHIQNSRTEISKTSCKTSIEVHEYLPPMTSSGECLIVPKNQKYTPDVNNTEPTLNSEIIIPIPSITPCNFHPQNVLVAAASNHNELMAYSSEKSSSKIFNTSESTLNNICQKNINAAGDSTHNSVEKIEFSKVSAFHSDEGKNSTDVSRNKDSLSDKRRNATGNTTCEEISLKDACVQENSEICNTSREKSKGYISFVVAPETEQTNRAIKNKTENCNLQGDSVEEKGAPNDIPIIMARETQFFKNNNKDNSKSSNREFQKCSKASQCQESDCDNNDGKTAGKNFTGETRAAKPALNASVKKLKRLPEFKVTVIEYIVSDEEEFWNIQQKESKPVSNKYRRHANSISHKCVEDLNPSPESETKQYQYDKYSSKSHENGNASKIIPTSSPHLESNTAGKPGIFESFKIFKDPAFLVITLIMTNYEFIFVTMLAIIVDYSRDVGIPETNSKWLLMSFSLGNIFSRFSFSFVTDKNIIQRNVFTAICFTGVAFMIAGLPFSRSFTAVLIFCSGFGVFESSAVVMYPLLLKQYIDSKKLTMAIASSNIGPGLITFLIPLAIGAFRDVVESYDGLLYLIVGASLLNAVLCLALPCVKQKNTIFSVNSKEHECTQSKL